MSSQTCLHHGVSDASLAAVMYKSSPPNKKVRAQQKVLMSHGGEEIIGSSILLCAPLEKIHRPCCNSKTLSGIATGAAPKLLLCISRQNPPERSALFR